jgi:hypothetical protein
MTNGVPCYLRGTHIRTPKGERKIEELKIGDVVYTFSGESKPIKWIGHERFKKERSQCWPEDFVPIRIRRFALDERTPHRDLYLSRNHAIYIDGVLIPATYLVNGRSITRSAPEGVDMMEFLHVELFAHDVIYAEGATAETFRFVHGNREHFDNFAEYYRLYPNESETEHTPCAPLLWGESRFPKLLQILRSRPLRHATDPWVGTRATVIRDKIRDRIATRARELVES